jgi:hypothetical protein
MNPTQFSAMQQVLSAKYSTSFELAIACAEAGVKVFPLAPTGKTPLAGSNGFKDSTTDVNQITDWFRRTKSVVALPATMNALVIIDLDVDEDKDAVAHFEALEDTHGAVETFTVRSPRGGLHLYFQHPSPAATQGQDEYIKQGTNIGAPGFDVRTQGYVIAPSPEKNNGKVYEVIDDSPIAELPAWLHDYVTQTKSLTTYDVSAYDDGDGSGPAEGGRNDYLSRIAFKMFKEGDGPDEMLEKLAQINADCVPPLPSNDLITIVNGKFNSGIAPGVKFEDAATRLGAVLHSNEIEPLMQPYEKKFDPLRMPTSRDDVRLNALLQEFVYIENGTQVASVLKRRDPVSKLAEWKHSHPGTHTYEVDGKTKHEKLVDGWLRWCLKCRGELFAPGESRIVERDSLNYFNVWAEPNHEDDGQDPALFLEHCERILPYATERKIFLDWLAYKVQNPAKRAYAILMVANDTQGIGRSSIGKAIEHALGQGVRPLTYEQFAGTGGQSSFDDWQHGLLLGIVNEAVDASTGKPHDKRTAAYELIKMRVDNLVVSNVTVNKKGGTTWLTDIYSNFIIFSNHNDAFPLPKDDRRVCVLRNDASQPSDEYFHRVIDPMRTSMVEAARIYHWLKRRDVSQFSAGIAPMTTGKDQMIHSAGSFVDEVVAYVKEAAPGALMTPTQWMEWCRFMWREYTDDGESIPSMMVPVFAKIYKRFSYAHPDGSSASRVRIGGKQDYVRVINRDWLSQNSFEGFGPTSDMMRTEAEKNAKPALPRPMHVVP